MLCEVHYLVIDIVQVEVRLGLPISITCDDFQFVQFTALVNQPHSHKCFHKGGLLEDKIYNGLL